MGQGNHGRFGGGDGRAGQLIHYPTDVQPMFDAKCVKCHGASESAGGLRLTGKLTLFYHTSYEALGKKQLAGPMIPEFTSFLWRDRGNYNGACLPLPRLGCYTSTLIDVLTNSAHPKNAKDGHSRMLTERELMILSRWVDTKYQFCASYFGRQHPQWVNRDPAVPTYDPADFRRKSTLAEATRFPALEWHR
ncbi:MAG: hypothetical protein MUE50_13470 [Pirellulaceae bacterium]|jgi:hypothetical protein|nr:hypothetical protein [Pirellulaceae bacterium]